MVTVATDGFDRYNSVVEGMNGRYLELGPKVLDRWTRDVFLGAADDHVFDFRKPAVKERLFAQKENDWMKFGHSKEFLDSMRSQAFWDAQYAKGERLQQKNRRFPALKREGVTAMLQFTLNHDPVVVPTDRNLLEYLREEARLTSVKDGCAEGVCGSCSVLVNGKALRACTLTVAKVQGKTVTTVEGLSPREREVYSWAFGEVGAVQCGFCMPGVVISAKSLLDQNPDPSPIEIKRAIRYNLCRCTGYLKIEKAIELAATALRNENALNGNSTAARVGERAVSAGFDGKAVGNRRVC